MATPFQPRFDAARVEQMKAMLKLSTLPENSVEPLDDNATDIGIKLDWLKDAKTRLESFDINTLEATINQFDHFTAPIEDATIHFVHERSPRADALPLLILHGWPGLFYDFHKIIKQLAQPDDPTQPAFHVVAPSLPGYAWSTLPRKKKFGLDDVARIFNSLMTDVLGYKEYVGQGGDWGSHVMRFIGQNHSANAKLILYNMFHSPPSGVAAYAQWIQHLPISQTLADNITNSIEEWGLPETQLKALRRRRNFTTDGRGYLVLQSTRPATIGYAIASSPLSMLAYIGEKFLAWSDPRLVDMDDLLATVAIYYLTSSFQTSVMIYQQSKESRAWLSKYEVWGKIKSLMAYSSFPYEISSPPAAWIAKCGPLVQYKTHEKGGHFPALDNPEGLMGDLREFAGAHWKDRK